MEEMLKKANRITRRDGIETIYNSGWDLLSPKPYKIGGVLPDRYFNFLWRRRHSYRSLYKKICRLDAATGALKDYICEDPEQSLNRFHQFKTKYPDLAELEVQIAQADGVVINGEGTLIFSNPMKRDALYLLFIIALARSVKKPVFLLNAMITECPYSGSDTSVLKKASELLKYCSLIGCREEETFSYTESLVGRASLRLIPDALFTWGERFCQAASAIKTSPELCLPFQTSLDYDALNFRDPYICVSASSSAWRGGKATGASFVQLANHLKKTRLRIYFISTCAGDNLLADAAREARVSHIPQNISVFAGAGIIAGSAAYVTGRYHPAIMAGAGGVPTVFMSSNSHKTKSVQKLLGYDSPQEFSITPSASDISAIVSMVSNMIASREVHAQRIKTHFDMQAARAKEYETILGGKTP